MKVNIIVATDLNGVFSADGKIPWHIPEDLKRFKELTTGHAVIMGRLTWNSLLVKPLPDRENFVVCSRENYKEMEGDNFICRKTLEGALRTAQAIGNKEAFIIGGQELYKEALPLADNVYLTLVDQMVKGNDLRVFNLYSLTSGYKETLQAYHGLYSFINFERIK